MDEKLRDIGLIETLVDDLRPVAVQSPVTNAFRWTLFSFLFLCMYFGLVLLIGKDLSLPQPNLVVILSLSSLFLATFSTFYSSVPGSNSGWVVASIFSWSVLQALVLWFADSNALSQWTEQWHLSCALNLTVLTSVPAWIQFKFLRKTRHWKLHWVAITSALSATNLSFFGMLIVCPVHTGEHIFVSHSLPAIGITLILLAWEEYQLQRL